MRYAVSLDWLEVYGISDLQSPLYTHDVYYADDEFKAKRREYGTRVYARVFDVTISGDDFMTICIQPLSRRSAGGIMDDAMCHVKLANYWLYCDNWYDIFTHALRLFRIKPKRLSRIDIACDWQHGECGLYAADLLKGLVKRKYLKIHQPSWRANGTDAAQLSWHSLAFGSKSSPVFTRFYNKSLELQTTGKDYIADTWRLAGLNMKRDVYRTEFQLSDTGRDAVDPDTGEVFDITLDMVKDRGDVASLFFHYAQHYFDIRKAGTATRRTNCTRLRIFPDSPAGFIPVQRPRHDVTNRTDRLVVKRMIQSLFLMPDMDAKRFMYNSIREYVRVKRSRVLCADAMRLLLDALHDESIDVDSLIREMFDMTRDYNTKYDAKGLWLYKMCNNADDGAGVYV